MADLLMPPGAGNQAVAHAEPLYDVAISGNGTGSRWISHCQDGHNIGQSAALQFRIGFVKTALAVKGEIQLWRDNV